MKETFAGTVREVLKEFGAGGKEIVIQDAAWDPRLDLVFDKDKRPLYIAVRDMLRAGEIERVRPGVYKYIGRMTSPEMQEIMWKVLRSQKTRTIEDLQQMAGASENYTKEWLRMLIRRKMVRKNKNGTYTLFRDPGPIPPLNEEKAAKLRRIRREKKKAALESIDKIANTALGAHATPELLGGIVQDAMEAGLAIADIPED